MRIIALVAITTNPFATGEWWRHFKMLGCTRGISPIGISAIFRIRSKAVLFCVFSSVSVDFPLVSLILHLAPLLVSVDSFLDSFCSRLTCENNVWFDYIYVYADAVYMYVYVHICLCVSVWMCVYIHTSILFQWH